MSNLNNNTTQLELLLEKVNALPEAGSGGGGTDTSDATATADEIFAGETAYVANGKVTGTFTIENELATQDDLISQISTLVAQKANPSGGIDIETCTVTVTCPQTTDWGYAYTAYDGTAITSIGLLNVGQNTLTLENVICRSSIFLYNTGGIEHFLQLSDATMQIIWWTTGCGQIMAPANAGIQATIVCHYD